MPQGKPAGVRCLQLDAGNRCKIFGHAQRPAVCAQLMPSAEMCGPVEDGAVHAVRYLSQLELLTTPESASRSPMT
jgi:uncharacterized protein